jgi:hypothetical protein
MSLDTSGAPAADSPPAEAKTENESASAPEGSNAADSSNADDDGAQPKDLLSVVRDAVTKDEGEADPPTAKGEEEANPAEAEAKPGEGKAEAESQEEADAKLPFHQHPRWKEVIAERDGYKEDAQRFRQVDSFMQQHGLTAEEVGEGFDIMAKLKSGTAENLAEVRDYFASRIALLDDALGNVLPEDLRERVENGQLDEEAAQELAKARAKDKLRTQQDETRAATETAERQRSEALANATASATAVEEWEARTKAADPDYAKKADLIELTCRAIVQETGKPPRNPEEAVALAQQAYERVTDKLKAALPKPKAVRENPIGSSAKTVAERPKTLRDAITASLNG